ncbi:peptidylprolyl isomerase [Jatrophihabitans sp. YIM 134969]
MPTNKQERERARRNLQQQLERRREAEARRRKTMIGVTVVGTLVVIGVVLGLVIGLGGNDSGTKPVANGSDSSAPTSATTAPANATTGPCGYTPAAAGNTNLTDVGLPPDPDPTPTIARTLTFTSNLGPIVVKMDGAGAPCNVQSIAYLAQKGFYDGTNCPRTVDSGIFVVQCGDPSGTTAGGPTYTTKDENLSAAKYTAGAVAMANSGPNTNGSQFFFITADSQLGQNYTVIGQVTTGLDLLDKVVKAGNDGSNQAGGGKPKQELKFTKVTVSPELDLAAASSAPASGAPSSATG